MKVVFMGVVVDGGYNVGYVPLAGWEASGIRIGDVVHTVYHVPVVLVNGDVLHRFTKVFSGNGRMLARSGSWLAWK